VRPTEGVDGLDRCTKPVLLIAHSLGTSLVMRWAHAAKTEAVTGAFLVAPSDRDRFENDPDSPTRGGRLVSLRSRQRPRQVGRDGNAY
jgi:predicted alpha/beta hydrolase family esterase